MPASWTELDDALAQLLAHAAPLCAVAALPCEHAVGRVLARDVVAELAVPPADNSAMDGYAIRLADFANASARLPVSQRVAAGDVPVPLAPQSLARIFTGASVPAGADAVQMQELTEVHSDGQVGLKTLPAMGEYIRRAGEDIATGQVIIAKGRRITVADVGLAASVGERTLQVAARPKVALISSGNELVEPGHVPASQLPAGHIFNSNRYFLQAMLQQLGCDVTDLGVAPDSLDATQRLLAQAAQAHDVVLSSGGVSVGEEDHIKAAVQAHGELALWQIAMKPGKPFAFGRLNGAASGPAWFLGLPGNPVSSYVCFALLVRPFLLALQGMPVAVLRDWPSQPMRANFAVPSAGKRREFLRVRCNPSGGLDLFLNQSSGVLTSLAWADGLVDLPAGETVAAGQMVRYIRLQDLA